MSDAHKSIQLPIDGMKFNTARGIFTARLVIEPDYVIRGDKMTSTICHNINFEGENNELRNMLFWLAPEYEVADPTMEKTHHAAFAGIQGWIESSDFDSDQRDYWLNEKMDLVPYDPFGS